MFLRPLARPATGGPVLYYTAALDVEGYGA